MAQQSRRRSLPNMGVVNEPLLKILQCRQCSELMQPPIHQCLNGHSFCPDCFYRNKNCPTCCSDFTDKRNMVMESLVQDVKLPCDNAARGCVETMHVNERVKHLGECSFTLGRYQCQAGTGHHGLTRCLWSGAYEQLREHVAEQHPHYIATHSKGHVTFQSDMLSGGGSVTSLVQFGRCDLFWWQRRHSAAERRFYAVLQHVDRPPRVNPASPRFRYAVQFRAQLGTQDVLFANYARSHAESAASIFKAGTCIVLDVGLLPQLVNRESLCRYQLSIARVDSAGLPGW
ncbi:E3 ubiquitin-protein ligase sina-like [Bacillus rossius redtenbacheri]|uniref:E3 ubiquitin-protein ligase sina-like n=1 Tax=Bacillus rossius redtenbacheri TaxID=93214 RepID=UPI002FDD8CD6